jgi:hypothetical protein
LQPLDTATQPAALAFGLAPQGTLLGQFCAARWSRERRLAATFLSANPDMQTARLSR